MAWTTPVDQSTGFLVTAAVYNAQIIDNLKYLHGDAGAVTFGSNLQSINGSTSVGGDGTNDGWALANTAGNAYLAIARSSASFGTLVVSQTGDSQYRLNVNADGSLHWSRGSGSFDTAVTTPAAGQLAVASTLLQDAPTPSSVSVPSTFTPNLSTGPAQFVNVTSGGAATLTIAAPSNPPAATRTAFLVVRVGNTGGGVVTLSWNAAFVAGAVNPLPASVANSSNAMAMFVWTGTKWQLQAIS